MELKKYSLLFVLIRSGEMAFFSQTDLMYLLERALRRTSLPLYITQGFRPHVKMSFGQALKVGVEGKMNVTFYFFEDISPNIVQQQLRVQLPEGLSIIPFKDELM